MSGVERNSGFSYTVKTLKTINQAVEDITASLSRFCRFEH